MDLAELLASLMFKNNPNLRPKGAKIPYAQDQIDELRKCATDPVYFICNYVKVVHPDRGVVLLELYDFQKKMIKTYHENRFSISRTARQQGKTTVAAAYFVWYVIFNKNKSVAILANKQATADEILSRIRMAYENLPKWLQSGIVGWNKRSIELENGSKIFGAATSSSGIRGKTINCVDGKETITVRNKNTNEIKTLPIGEFCTYLNNSTNANSSKDIHETDDYFEVRIS